jgi:hypothetical protein
MEATFLLVRRELYTPPPEIVRWQSGDHGVGLAILLYRSRVVPTQKRGRRAMIAP